MRAITKGRIVPIVMALMIGMAGATAWSAVTGVVSGTVVAAETGAAPVTAHHAVAPAIPTINAMMIGTIRPFVIALISLTPSWFSAIARSTNCYCHIQK